MAQLSGGFVGLLDLGSNIASQPLRTGREANGSDAACLVTRIRKRIVARDSEMTEFGLISPLQLQEELSGEPENPPVLIEAHFSSFDHPLEGDVPVSRHLAGAIQIHPSYLESGFDKRRYYPCYTSPEDGNLLPQPELAEVLEEVGIFPERKVVVYGTEPDGVMAASRLAWGLLQAGVERVRLLDGGLMAWMVEGNPTVGEVARPVRRNRPGSVRGKWKDRPDWLATTPEVSTWVAQGASAPVRLVDVRRSGEYLGEDTGYYPFLDKAGRVPSAVWQGDWGNLVDPVFERIGPILGEVRRRWTETGIVDSEVENGARELVFYCGTGWRSSIAFLCGLLLGYRVRNYDDGFYGWSWSGENEIESGPPP